MLEILSLLLPWLQTPADWLSQDLADSSRPMDPMTLVWLKRLGWSGMILAGIIYGLVFCFASFDRPLFANLAILGGTGVGFAGAIAVDVAQKVGQATATKAIPPAKLIDLHHLMGSLPVGWLDRLGWLSFALAGVTFGVALWFAIFDRSWVINVLIMGGVGLCVVGGIALDFAQLVGQPAATKGIPPSKKPPSDEWADF